MKDKLIERLDILWEKLLDTDLKRTQGINQYIFDYDPKYELLVRSRIKDIVNDPNLAAQNKFIKEYDLYELLLAEIEADNLLEAMFAHEKANGPQRFLKDLNSYINPDRILNKMKENLAEHNIIFVTGVGKAYPFISANTALGKLASNISTDIPVLLFFPGEYNEMYMQLFNRLEPNNYYRAKRIVGDL